MIVLWETSCDEGMCNILDRQILGEISLDFNTERGQSCAARGGSVELCEVGDEQRDAEGVEVEGGVEHSGARALQGLRVGRRDGEVRSETRWHSAGTG